MTTIAPQVVPDALYNTRHAAILLNMGRSTIYREKIRGTLRATLVRGRSYYKGCELLRYMRENSVREGLR